MNLKNYINWTKEIDDYKTAPSVANVNAWGYKVLGNVKFPDIDLSNPTHGNEGYSSIRNDKLSVWARETWADLQCVNAKIQIQRPGEKCHPHLDFLGEYLESVCETMPGLLKLEHSLEKPALDVWRMFVAMEDHIPGHVFSINDQCWEWTKGECIRLNNWQALHWTENTSTVDRKIIKITGVKF
jgi:hypothetical protein